jgi:hypothetical protein
MRTRVFGPTQLFERVKLSYLCVFTRRTTTIGNTTFRRATDRVEGLTDQNADHKSFDPDFFKDTQKLISGEPKIYTSWED